MISEGQIDLARLQLQDGFDLEAGMAEEQDTPVNTLDDWTTTSIVLDMDPDDSPGEDDPSQEALLKSISSELLLQSSSGEALQLRTSPAMKDNRSNSLRSDTSSKLEVIEESPTESPESSLEPENLFAAVSTEPKSPLDYLRSPQEVSHSNVFTFDPANLPESLTRTSLALDAPKVPADPLMVESITSSFDLSSTHSSITAETDMSGIEEGSDPGKKEPDDTTTPGYADFDPNMFTKVFSIPEPQPEPQPPISPKLIAVNSISSIPEDSTNEKQVKTKKKEEWEEDVYISPIPTPRDSRHQGSLKELQEHRAAKQRERLQSISNSPRGMTDHPSRISESYSPGGFPRRLSLDVPDLIPHRGPSISASPGTSPVTSPVRSKVVKSRSGNSPVESESARQAVESMFTSPNARRRLSTQVRRSKAFASFFGGRDEEENPDVAKINRRMSLAMNPSSKNRRASDAKPNKKQRRSTLTKIADAVVSAFISRSEDESSKKQSRKKEKVAQTTVNRQISQPMDTPSFLIDELSPEQEEAVIQPLPAQIIPPPPVRMGRGGRRNSIMPGQEPPQLVMRKMDTKAERPKSANVDGPKIDDVVFTVNTKGEMEMFEVVPVAQPAVPAGRIKDVDSMEQFKRAILSAHDALVCVTFSAKWCGPWRMIKPDVHRLSHIHGDVIFYEVDVDDNEEIAVARRVVCMPTFQFFKCGYMLDKFAEPNRIKLDETIRKLRRMEVKEDEYRFEQFPPVIRA